MAARSIVGRRLLAASCQQSARRTFATSPLVRAEAQGSSSGGKGPSNWQWGLGAFSVLAAAGTLGLMLGSKRTDDLAKEARKLSGASTQEKVDYQKVYNAIAEALEENAENYDDGSYGPVLVRLAWHCSGTYDKETGNGGSNGATMRFAPEADHGANAGLKNARDKLEPIKAKFPGISYSDLWTLAGVVAVQEMGGPKIPWRPGRQDGLVENCTPDGRLPDGDKGADHIRKIFYRMGFGDQEIVALSGAHALGRCHKDRSGFDGPWTYSPITFSNEYYRLLFDEKWQKRKWEGPIQMQNKSNQQLMMLTTDMALTTDKAFKPITKRYAEDEGAFFSDFSKAFAKLIELGVPTKNFSGEPMTLKTTSELAA